MYHFLRVRNLPYTIEEVRTVNRECPECAEVKPRFHKPTNAHLIKATQPWERLSVDFKGPLPSNNPNIYQLNIIDEYSRFPFSFPCSNMKSSTVIKCFTQLFSIFGMPQYIHSDRGTSFLSTELQQFLHSKGISSSRTTPYNPGCNGQVEKLNDTIWKAVTLALKSRKLPLSCWQDVLPDALHSIRSLLCVATNQTPHERLLKFQRKTTTGDSTPAWLSEAETVLLRRHVRNSKHEPFTYEVTVLHVNPQYAHIRKEDGTETTVSIHDLAPAGHRSAVIPEPPPHAEHTPPCDITVTAEPLTQEAPLPITTQLEIREEQPVLRRSDRIRRAPDRLGSTDN